MLLDLKFSIGTLGIGSGAFIAALYGMNLKNFIEESDIGFWGVTTWSVVFSAIICSYGLAKLRKVQRVSMFGEGGRKGRNWRDEDASSRLNEGARGSSWERQKRLRWDREEATENMRAQAIKQRLELAMQQAAAKKAQKEQIKNPVVKV
jgi:magnesium transporter